MLQYVRDKTLKGIKEVCDTISKTFFVQQDLRPNILSFCFYRLLNFTENLHLKTLLTLS